MSKLSTIRKYAEELRNASVWAGSGDAIADIEVIDNESKRAEYIYEFYCLIRIIIDLSSNYKVKIANNSNRNIFPKSPSALKRNFPFFRVYDKDSDEELFQVCPGVSINGVGEVTSSPDIQFHHANATMEADYQDVFMLMDPKFRHSLPNNIRSGEYDHVAIMVRNLQCEDEAEWAKVQLNELSDLAANCVLSNGGEYKAVQAFHRLNKLKEVSNFADGMAYTVHGW